MLKKLVKLLFAGPQQSTGDLRISFSSSVQMGPGQSPIETFAPTLGTVSSAELLAERQRFAEQADALARQLPDDPLDNPAMVDLFTLYLNEPPEESDRLNAEYRALRQRFLRWKEEARDAGDPVAGRTEQWSLSYPQLAAELRSIQEEVAKLAGQAADAPQVPERARQAVAEAGGALAKAKPAYTALATQSPVPAMATQLEDAEQQLRAATAALTEGATRPLTALRLASEAAATAKTVDAQAQKLMQGPEQIARRQTELEAQSVRVRQEIEDAKAALQAVVNDYAPTCWREIHGAGAAAERAMQRAHSHGQAAADADHGAGAAIAGMDAAMRELDAGFDALTEASTQARRITDHMAKLETAVAGAREFIEQAEAAIDRGWAALAQRSATEELIARQKAVLDRAAALVAQSREQLALTQTDPLAVVALAERAKELAAAVPAGEAPAVPAVEETAGAREALVSIATRAKAARDRALALSWTVSANEISQSTRVLIDRAEAAYQRAVGLEAALTADDASARLPQALEHVAIAFRTAEELATAGYEAGWLEVSRPKRLTREPNVDRAASAMIGGVVGSVIFEIFGNQ